MAEALADTPPPACLSAPVTIGNVTLSCTLLESAQENAAFDAGAPQPIGATIFQVKISSSDPEVVGFRVGVTFLYSSGGSPTPITTWGTVGKSQNPFGPTPAPPASPYYRYTFFLSASQITAIQVQELKAATTQTF